MEVRFFSLTVLYNDSDSNNNNKWEFVITNYFVFI